MTPVIIDTDIGTDVDDAIALFYAVKSGIDVKLVTTVHGDTMQRAKIAKKLMNLLGPDVPVAKGEEKPIKQKHIYWYGDEGKDFIPEREDFDIKEDGVGAIAETIYANRNNISIISIGPLTNIAKAFQQYPDLSPLVSRIYVMGNVILRENEYIINYRAHNFKVDPEAVDIVFAAKTPKVIVTTEVCKQNSIAAEEFKQLGMIGNPALDYICRSAAYWMKKNENKEAYLYDPLVVHHSIDDSITTRTRYGNDEVTTGIKAGFRQTVLNALQGG